MKGHRRDIGGGLVHPRWQSLGLDARSLRIIGRRKMHRQREPFTRKVDFKAPVLQEGLVHAGGILDEPQGDGTAERVAIGRRAGLAHRLAVAKNELAAPEHRQGIIDRELHDTLRRRAARLCRNQRFPADETTRLVKRYREGKTRLIGGDVRCQLAAPRTIAFFKPQRLSA